MLKRLCAAGLLLAAVLCLAGCRYLPGQTAAPSPTPNPTPAARLTSLYFSEGGSYFKRVQGYEFRAEGDRYTAYFYMANEEELYPVPVDQAWVDTLNGFIVQYGMTDWNGFSGSAPGLLDGTQFSIDFTLDDGTQVQAGGYGSFPAGYGDASAAIDAHFMQLLPEDMRDW